jgi:hypothetical protein
MFYCCKEGILLVMHRLSALKGAKIEIKTILKDAENV